MNTIHEIPLGDFDGTKTLSSASTVSTTNTKISSSSSATTSATNTNGQSTSANAAKATNGASTVLPHGDHIGDLKILGQLKNIEKINETRRRIFLNSTIGETTTIEEQFEAATESNVGGNSDATNGKGDDTVYFVKEERMHVREEQHVDSSTDLGATAPRASPKLSAPLKSPTTPPPKPPMLSRTRSLGVGDNRSSVSSPPLSPTGMNTEDIAADFARAPAASPQSSQLTPVSPAEISAPITTATVTAATMPEPVQVTAVALRRVERPQSLSPRATKEISGNHYERLVEELKCPGCAYPMKAPILLCKTGHSICEQCTRVLMMCPLCKEPFTSMRSLTVEALCSKAHFRCANASGGCTVRLQFDLLAWHEKQCIYKPMKCFMGRVWGDCQWSGREAYWKEHLEKEHANKVFTVDGIDLIWNMGAKQKLGYYVFEVFDEMFNFYLVDDKERILFTMACTSTVKEKKYNYAFEVTMINQDNEALAITQKFPVHSEYDADILAEGTCVSILLSDLAKFIDDDRLLHYRARILEIKTPRKCKNLHYRKPDSGVHPTDFQQTQIEGVNLKNVPSDVIVTRKLEDIPYADNGATGTANSPDGEDSDSAQPRMPRKGSDSESDPEFEAFIAKRWGTPQLHFNRKFLRDGSNENSSNDDSWSPSKGDKRLQVDDRMSISSTGTSYKKKMTNSLRKSFRSLKAAPNLFTKKSSEKNGV